MREVAHEARVVDRADRADAHRAGGELPEVRHQVRVRVAAQPARAAAVGEGRRGEFLAVVVQVFFAQAAFEVGPRIHAGRAVRLEEHEVAAVRRAARMEEVVEAGLEQVGRARVAGDVAAEFAVRLVGLGHHGERVPAHERGELFLDGKVTRKRRLVGRSDGVDVRRGQLGLPADALLPRQARQLGQHLARALRTLRLRQRQEGVAPFGGLFGVGVVRRRRVEQQGAHLVGGDRGVHASTLSRLAEN
ncbi:hypothetical protein D3C71_1231880 [compost metagenome]